MFFNHFAVGATAKTAYDLAVYALELPVFLFLFILVHPLKSRHAEAENTKQYWLQYYAEENVTISDNHHYINLSRKRLTLIVFDALSGAFLTQHGGAPDTQRQQYHDIYWYRYCMENYRVPKAQETSKKYLGKHDSEVFEHHKDEVLLCQIALIQQLCTVLRD